ncbi:FAD-dependent monooxygenase [Nocardia coubleae]|uniref:FAD-binding domain-containing protein n=1 Tax=Nocardia coubleae TaxID=356147 RepID=A0A846W7Y7_9NOCA|nr:FAD-dependent monooxygenase [Nocardia coubleae]NKX89482.1 hypothetical protein [Nocardia coubleae]
MTKSNGKIIILGGGIGGLCASIAFRRVGLDAHLYEQSASFGEVGAGIQVWVKGMKAFRELGLADEIRRRGAEVYQHQFFNPEGTPLYRAPLADLARQHNAPMPVMIRRPELIDALSGSDDLGPVSFNHRAVAVEQNARGVTVTFENGHKESADIVVAADGINSRIRRAVFPDVHTRTASYRYVRALARREPPNGPNLFTMYFGRGNRIAIGDCGDNYLYWLVGLKNPTLAIDEPNERLKDDLLQRFSVFPDAVRNVIEVTPPSALIHHYVRDVEPLPSWSSGRIVFLGDSAHATTPNLGRGAGEAILDSIVLARQLSQTSLRDQLGIDSAFAAYEAARRPQSEALQQMSWKIGLISSWDGFAATKVRDLMMKTIVGKKQVEKMHEEFQLDVPSLPQPV